MALQIGLVGDLAAVNLALATGTVCLVLQLHQLETPARF